MPHRLDKAKSAQGQSPAAARGHSFTRRFSLVTAPRGRVEFDGQELRGLEPFEVSRRGLGFVAEDCRLFNIIENGEIRYEGTPAPSRRIPTFGGSA